MLVVVALKQLTIECLTSAIVALGAIRPENSGAVRTKKLVCGCLGMPGDKSPRHAQYPLLGK